ncbi:MULTISPECIES: gamma-mobile-trio recombinase GmtY [unclassified Caballeronia]|uniref:gamma-mobile-trio recombinase GmtY n=1 Tax=unclassified Caballeronia TaxID=2646786 RepID=UPI00285A8F8B|nr:MULTISPECIES: gamma-mobile-trio recombinase GmtY [unclassified Caballeronia]MDR5777140.1 gamma-mobile-trio recombinase GmtY [Caballeronia sp. LZ002]MDR5798704.1 gamma-mobile-trio recombinase GmtY [Caballeronia sp. LZ001]MDR5852527.1 gamma-mobile-trio recombinase GmtY [Caballeronia sp. LZ003]
MFVNIKAKVLTDETNVYTEIPALLTASGVLEPLVDYFLHRSHDRSLEWMRKVTRSIRLFLEYIQVNPSERDAHRLFQNFAQRLYTGTFDRETGLDATGLCWLPRSPNDAARIIIHLLSDFFSWLGEIRPEALMVNPRYASSAFDQQTDEEAYQYRRSKAFLGHIWASNPTPRYSGYRLRYRSLPKIAQSEPPAFPEHHFEALLFKGFRHGGQYDYRGILITLLLHGAGFRESEPFHVYVQDVFSDSQNPRQAKVLIHHPRYGAAPADWCDELGRTRKSNRADYLGQRFGLVPRTDLLDRRHAGWKGGMHDAPFYKQAYWFVPHYGEWFLELWHCYLKQVARFDRDHPFAFINLKREPYGAMYTLTQYNKAHAAACKRIGLEVGKTLGTTPHGHRHAYGQRLKRAGVEKSLIRRFMHHSCIESQEIYTRAGLREIRDALDAAVKRLQGDQAVPLSKFGPFT